MWWNKEKRLSRQGSEVGRNRGKVPRGWVEYLELEKITQQQEAEFDEVLPSRFGNPIHDGNVTLEKKYDVSFTNGKGNGRGSNGNARQQHN